MAKKKRRKSKSSRRAAKAAPRPSKGGNKPLAFIGVLLPLLGWIITYLVDRKDKYAMYYGKQGVVLLVVALVLNWVLAITIIGIALIPILQIIVLVLWVFGLVYSLSGKKKPIPIVGRLAGN